jgi:hypothetical protein
MEALIIFLVCIIIIILLAILVPIIAFAEGWIIGWFINKIFGITFCAGLALLHINISPDSIPLVCGVISVIGAIFAHSGGNGINKETQEKIDKLFDK